MEGWFLPEEPYLLLPKANDPLPYVLAIELPPNCAVTYPDAIEPMDPIESVGPPENPPNAPDVGGGPPILG